MPASIAPLFNAELESLGGLSLGNQGIGELMPGLTTIVIVATFLITFFKIYKYVRQLMGAGKGINYEGFDNMNIGDRTRFINRSQNPPTPSANKPADDAYEQH